MKRGARLQDRTVTPAFAGVALAAFACSWTPPAVRPAETPPPAAPRPAFSERDLLVEPPAVSGDDVVRFPDELWPLSDAVATVLARPEAGGYKLVPSAELRALWRDVQAGRLPGVAAICDAQPPPARLAGYVYRGASSADMRVDCPEPERDKNAPPPCRLQVTIRAFRPTADVPDGTDEVARFEAELPAGERPEQWAQRVRASGLRRFTVPEPTGELALRGLDTDDARRPLIVVGDVAQSGGWNYPISDATFASQRDAIVACGAAVARRPSRDWWVQPYLIEVDAAGTLKRCEFAHVDHLPPPEFACVCGALRQVPFGAGLDGRRARFDLTILAAPPAGAPRDRLTRGFMLTAKRSSDPSAILGTGEIDEVSKYACLWRVTSALPRVDLPVRFVVGPDGRTAHHEAVWPATVSPELRRCLDPVLAGARFNCPLSGGAIVDARLSLVVWD